MLALKKRVNHFISSNRKSIIISAIAKFFKSYLKAFENWNNDHETNGEFFVLKKLSRFSIQVIVDVGANVGDWSIFASQLNNQAIIYSFEPIPPVYEKLKENTNNTRQIKSFNLGLSNENNRVIFNYYPDGILFNSIYQHPRGGTHIQVSCEVQTGDSFFVNEEINCIDLLKIDVEGGEHHVLQGFSTMLKAGRIKAIQFEYGSNNIQSKFLLKDFYELLKSSGYTIGKIYPNYVEFSDYTIQKENLIESNYLAIHESCSNWISELN